MNSFVRMFVRSFVVHPSFINREFVRSSVRSFVCSSFVNREFVRPSVCLFVRSLVRSIARLFSESVGLSFCYPVSQPARQLVIRSVSKSVCQFFSQLLIFSIIHSILLDIDVRIVSELTSDLVSFCFQASDYAHVPVTLDIINVKTVDCPTKLTKSFSVKIKEKGATTFVVGIEKNALFGEQVHLTKCHVAWIEL